MTATQLSMRDVARVAGLDPAIRSHAMRTYHRVQSELCAPAPFIGILGECRREATRQAELWQRGRRMEDGRWMRTGKVVTKARPWESAHVFGLAWHIVLLEKPGGPWLGDSHPAWLHLGEIVRDMGWVWGGDWKFRDCAHIEDADWKVSAASQIAEMRSAWAQKGW